MMTRTLLLFPLLSACIGIKPSGDSGLTTFPLDDTGQTTFTHRDDTGPRDTGPYAAVFYEGEVNGDQERITSGRYGFAAYRYNLRSDRSDIQGDALCRSYAVLVDGDPIEATCGDCAYTYSLIGTEGGRYDGNACQRLLDAGMGILESQVVDDYFVGFSFGIGWVPTYRGYGFGAVMSYQFDYPEYGWFLFAYDYDVPNQAPNGKASGGNGQITWSRPIRDRNSKYEIYYDY